MRRSLAFLLLATSMAVPTYDEPFVFIDDDGPFLRRCFLPGKLGQVKFEPLVTASQQRAAPARSSSAARTYPLR